jgi:hypothetical protein
MLQYFLDQHFLINIFSSFQHFSEMFQHFSKILVSSTIFYQHFSKCCNIFKKCWNLFLQKILSGARAGEGGRSDTTRGGARPRSHGRRRVGLRPRPWAACRGFGPTSGRVRKRARGTGGEVAADWRWERRR